MWECKCFILYILQNDEMLIVGSQCVYLFESVAELRTKRDFAMVFDEGWGLTEVMEKEKKE